MEKSQSLKRKLRLGVSGVALACVLFTTIVISLANWQKFWQLHSQRQIYFTQYTISEINSWFDEHLRKVRFISQVSNLVNQQREFQLSLLNSIIESNSAISEIAILNELGEVVNAQNQDFDPEHAYRIDQKIIHYVLNSGMEHIDLCKFSEQDNNKFLILIYPLRDATGKVNGALRARLNLSYLNYAVSSLSFGKKGYAYILDPQNRIMIHNANISAKQMQNQELHKDYLSLLKETAKLKIYRGIDGAWVSGTRELITGINWILVVEMPLLEILYNMHKVILLMLLIAGIGVSLAFALARAFHNRISKSLDHLSNAAAEVSSGRFEVQIANIPNNELGEVAQAFNSMTTQLGTLFREAECRVRFEQLLAGITGLVIESKHLDARDIIHTIQNLCSQYLGASRSVIYVYQEEDDTFTGRYEWYRDDDIGKVSHEKISYTSLAFPTFIPVLKLDQIVCLSLSDGDKSLAEFLPKLKYLFPDPNLPCRETNLYKYIQKNDMGCIIGLPVTDGQNFLGKITFAFQQEPKDSVYWKESNLAILKNVISSALLYLRERYHLNQEHERLKTTMYSIGDALIATDASGNINLMNTVAEQLTGWNQTEAMQHKLEDVFRIYHPDTRKALDNPVATVLSERRKVELVANSVLISRDGSERIVSDSAAPIMDARGHIYGVVLVFRDETEKYHLQQEKTKLQRLEAVSLLAAGIAHDFNNLLTAILGNLYLAKDLVPHHSEAAKIITAAETSAEKGKDITSQLLIYAKGGIPERRVSGITKLIHETTVFLLKASTFQYKIDLDPKLRKIIMAEGIFNQILTNIILNAKQAYHSQSDTTKPSINIVARNVEVNHLFNLPLKDGTYVLVTVSDNGCGIAAEEFSRIFDPYFTTKNTGSGLGLTSVLALLKKHDGFITVNSKQNEGTRVNLYFPAAIDDAELEPELPATTKTTYRILGFESDGVLQKMIKKTLAPLNIDLVITSSLVDLMEWFKISQIGENAFDCIFLDMHNLSSDYLATVVNELRTIDPDIKLVLAGDLTEKSDIGVLKKIGFNEVIAKPFHIANVRHKLGNLIKS